jgi:hypothetical protein
MEIDNAQQNATFLNKRRMTYSYVYPYIQDPTFSNGNAYYPINPPGLNDSITNKSAFNIYDSRVPPRSTRIEFNVLRDDIY